MVIGEGERERNTPARTNCSFGKAVQILVKGSDWCGDHKKHIFLPVLSWQNYNANENVAELRRLDSSKIFQISLDWEYRLNCDRNRKKPY